MITPSGPGIASSLFETPPQSEAIDGMKPSAIARPRTSSELTEVMAEAQRLGLGVIPRGSGSAMSFGPPPSRVDLVVDTRGMDAVMDYAPRDLILGVGAGVTLGEIDRLLATEGQRLAIDLGPASASRTIGGVVATNGRGPRRVDIGALRDIVIGVTMVRADGVRAKAGGKVVKNVAGYDLSKLMVGSHGTLAVISELYLRVHPIPSARRVASIEGSLGELCTVVSSLARSPLVASAVELRWASGDDPARLHILFEGTERSVDRQSAAVCTMVAGARVTHELPPDWHPSSPHPDAVVLRLAFAPGELAGALDSLGSAPWGEVMGSCSATSGLATVVMTQAALDPERFGGGLASLRSRLASIDGSVVVEHAPLSVRSGVDVWGPTCAPVLMKALKDQFDPEHRLNPGRFVEGI